MAWLAFGVWWIGAICVQYATVPHCASDATLETKFVDLVSTSLQHQQCTSLTEIWSSRLYIHDDALIFRLVSRRFNMHDVNLGFKQLP